jgi:hypothetical protein
MPAPVAAVILPAVQGGILPPEPGPEFFDMKEK